MCPFVLTLVYIVYKQINAILMKFGFLFLLSVLIIEIWVNIHYALVRRCTKCSQESKEPTAEWRSEVSLTLITWKWI